MNPVHLKYVVEIEKTGSISKAAENLYMSQPNLSKAIKELENTLGFAVFNRSSKGITTTVRGAEFVAHARRVLIQLNEIERIFCTDQSQVQSLTVFGPHSAYFSQAAAGFAATLDFSGAVDFRVRCLTAREAVSAVAFGEGDLGVIRFNEQNKGYIDPLLHSKGLVYSKLFSFRHRVLVSREHPFAELGSVTPEQLKAFPCISCPDANIPFEPEIPPAITASDSFAAAAFLREISGAYMMSIPACYALLERIGCVQLDLNGENDRFIEAVVHDNAKPLSPLCAAFVGLLQETAEKFVDSAQK